MGLGVFAPAAHGQRLVERRPDAFLNQQRAIEDFIEDQLEKEAAITDKVAIDYGGWFSFNLFLYDDGVNSSRTFRRNDLRLWTRATFDQGAHEIYARMRMSFLDFNTGDSYTGKDNDWEGPNLERGFYKFDLRRAVMAYKDTYLPYNFKFKIGRDLVEFGTGYALSLPMDHILATIELDDVEITGLAGKSIGSMHDPDLSRPIARMHRTFFGSEIRYTGFERHRPFAYVLWNVDHNHEYTWDPLQQYDYDSFYVGLGSEGEIVPNLRYSTEWVYESGHSYGDRRFLRKDVIRAWAFDAQLEYLFDVPTEPRVSIEYMFAGGDPDRLYSPTNSVGGNQGDFEDNSFVGFGYRDTGLSFAPRLSNIHIWRAGGAFYPIEDAPLIRRLELGTDWFLYYKNRSDAAVSDATADVQSGYLGWEMDWYANWQIASDLSVTCRYGVFFPGDAFSDQTTRTFFLTGIVWSF